MATCATCGTEGVRTRSRWDDKGTQLPDQCPACAPQSFEKMADPSAKKIWIGPEYAPNDYEKRYDQDGVYYMPKPEVTAEREAKLFKDSDEDARYARALAKKRAERRTAPLKPWELHALLRAIDENLRPMIEDQETAYDV